MDFPTRSRDELLAVCRFLRNFPCPWWLGGGWAIDSWLGSQSRDHEDIEICVARHDQGLIYSYCAAWDFLTPVNDQWAPLPTGTWLAVPQFMLQLQQTTHTQVTESGMPPTFEFLLNEVDGDQWKFYRNPDIQFPIACITDRSPWGMPVTRPELLLLHKAVYQPRPKDDLDFHRMLPHLTPAKRLWLHDAIASMHHDHPWITHLADEQTEGTSDQ
jgi:hypothetical protein